MLNVEVVKYHFVNIFLQKLMNRRLLEWSDEPLRPVLLSGLEEVLGGSDSSHVVVSVYGTFSDAISIYLHFVLLYVYCI